MLTHFRSFMFCAHQTKMDQYQMSKGFLSTFCSAERIPLSVYFYILSLQAVLKN